VKPFWTLLVGLSLLAVLPAHAQESSEDCQVGSLSMDGAAPSDSSTTLAKRADVTNPRPATAVAPTTDAEAYVQDVIENDGLHVVHFWAPWCPNSRRELGNGWADLVADNPNVTFTFVTVWNNDEKGDSLLTEYNLPDRVTEVTQPDLGPSDNEANRRQSFLSHPVTWIPSTWIFHNNGELAFAMNYGEMEMDTIQSLISTTRKDW
jgi:thiol-disulfide isomerase/thioredoxin